MPPGWQEKIDKDLCPVCGKPNKRTAFRCCSTECTAAFWKNEGVYRASKLPEKCFKRDDYTCRHCGANNKEEEKWQERFTTWLCPFYGKNLPDGFTRKGEYKQWFNKEQGRFTSPQEVYETQTGDKCPETVNFECDHVIPIALGGAEYDLNNLQTLCEKCHRKKTAREMQDFADARKGRTPPKYDECQTKLE